MRQFAAKANGNAIAYADPNEDTIAYLLAEAMAESMAAIRGTAWNKPADVGLRSGPQLGDPHSRQRGERLHIAKALFDSMGGEARSRGAGPAGHTASNARYAGPGSSGGVSQH